MKFALSTNWNNRRLEDGVAIVEEAAALGFEALELGFHTMAHQAQAIKRRDLLPVGSVHAFCPVPLSAPQGYPELYQLASTDEAMRALARVHVLKNIAFTAEMGARTLVLHAGRVLCNCWFKRNRLAKRTKRGAAMTVVFKRELDLIVPELEKNRVTLGLENLPYLEGYPADWEFADLCGDWVRPWFDTGHDFVRRENGWTGEKTMPEPVGLHINDSNGGDDHLPPGEGKVDFAAIKPLAEKARHVVFEPHAGVTPEALSAGLAYLKQLWNQ